jgi:hypothetical protein
MFGGFVNILFGKRNDKKDRKGKEGKWRDTICDKRQKRRGELAPPFTDDNLLGFDMANMDFNTL